MTSPQLARDLGHLILTLRGQRVLLDSDLAALYGVATGNLNKAVRRNLDRFPEDFMFQLNSEEVEALRFQSGTSTKVVAVAATSLMPSPRKALPCSPAF